MLHPAHEGPLPHWHAPPAEHVSALAGSQGVHDPPPTPHWEGEGIVHVVPLQQPPGQDIASQTHIAPEHRWPAAHARPDPQLQAPPLQPSATAPQLMHALPAAAHVFDVSGVHVPPEQHPPGHEVASHVQLPCEQRCPAPQAAPWLHVQAPAAEHPSPLFPQV